MKKGTAIVVGVGAEPGLGAALCRRFAGEGCHVVAAARTPAKLAAVVDKIVASGASAEACVADATREADVARLFDRAMSVEGRDPADLVVFNVGHNQRADFAALSAADFELSWRLGCYAGFLVAREAARRLAPLGRGTMIFTGASASLRGRPGFAQFAAAKAGLRSVAQAMAREYGPLGIHVAHVVIDGGIDGERLRERFPTVAEERGPGGLLDPDAIAEAYWQIHCQPRSAWTHEMDLRPYKEPF